MGYTVGGSPKGGPLFNSSPQTTADFNAVREFVERVGNRKIGTTSERNDASGREVWEGLLWGDTTDGFEYKYVSGGWLQLPRTGPWVTPTLEPGWTVFNPGEYAQYSITSGLVTLNGRVNATAAAGTKIFTLPLGFRPLAPLVTTLHTDFGTKIGQINPNGDVYLANKSSAAQQAVSLSSFTPFRGY